MALRDGSLIPEFFEISKCFVDGFFLPFLVLPIVGLVTDFICLNAKLLLSKDGS